MRAIEFRGKTYGGEWVYGNLCVLTISDYTHKAGHYISNEAGCPFAYLVRPETIGQFTGRLDSRGTKIFEGDKVGKAEIKWKNFDACFVAMGRFYEHPMSYVSRENTITGNIWDENE